MPGIRQLIAEGVNLNAYDALGHTPLHWAVISGDVSIVELLLKAGANPNILSLEGVTPTWRALKLEDEVIARLLASYGGKAEVPDEYKQSQQLRIIKRRIA